MSQTILSLPILYDTTIGTTRSKQWSVSVLNNGDDTFTIHTEHGTTGGKQVSHNTLITEGKNKGKKMKLHHNSKPFWKQREIGRKRSSRGTLNNNNQ